MHLPFCAAKCHYCDFYSVAAEGQDVDGLLDALLIEVRERAPVAPTTVFLGGGTPSLLDARQLTRVLEALERICGFRTSAAEVTAECNPESLDADKARLLVELGVTRLSIGFQSLRPETLQLFGRVHDVDQSFRAFEAAKRSGARVSVDLIYAVPGQSLGTWLEDLDRVLALGPDHVSAYALAFEAETLFQRWLDEGRLRPYGEAVELAFFEATRERLLARGFEPYEISNFARAGQQCLHNLNYWRNGDYVGLGPSAVSRIGLTRGGNARSVAGYRRRIESGEHAWTWSETPHAHARLGETWWLGLRLAEGVDPARARRMAAIPLDAADDPALRIAERLASEGWLERAGDSFRTSARGLPVADAIAREFLRLGLEVPRAAPVARRPAVGSALP